MSDVGTISRRITNPAGGFSLGATQLTPIIPLNLSFKMQAINSFSLELILDALVGPATGTFQILVSNDNVNWYAVPGATIDITGTGAKRYFIFAAAGISTVQYVNLNYTRTAGSGKLTYVNMSYNSN